MELLPIEVIDQIIGKLDDKELLKCRLVSRYWETISAHHFRNIHRRINFESTSQVHHFCSHMELTKKFPFSRFSLNLGSINSIYITKFTKQYIDRIQHLQLKITSKILSPLYQIFNKSSLMQTLTSLCITIHSEYDWEESIKELILNHLQKSTMQNLKILEILDKTESIDMDTEPFYLFLSSGRFSSLQLLNIGITHAPILNHKLYDYFSKYCHTSNLYKVVLVEVHIKVHFTSAHASVLKKLVHISQPIVGLDLSISELNNDFIVNQLCDWLTTLSTGLKKLQIITKEQIDLTHMPHLKKLTLLSFTTQNLCNTACFPNLVELILLDYEENFQINPHCATFQTVEKLTVRLSDKWDLDNDSLFCRINETFPNLRHLCILNITSEALPKVLSYISQNIKKLYLEVRLTTLMEQQQRHSSNMSTIAFHLVNWLSTKGVRNPKNRLPNTYELKQLELNFGIGNYAEINLKSLMTKCKIETEKINVTVWKSNQTVKDLDNFLQAFLKKYTENTEVQIKLTGRNTPFDITNSVKAYKRLKTHEI